MIATNPQGAELLQAAEWIRAADGLLITAGAGMGVDSGLPEFRGTAGFWRAYPALARARMRFESIASPVTFGSDCALAWGFYGHRLNLYRRTVAHEGFHILNRWAERKPAGAFVFTSNVDGQFQKAGFGHDQVAEVHGSIHFLQCLEPCSEAIWPAAGFEPRIDEERCRLLSAPPTCARCGSLARPNILMFGDGGWIPSRADAQMARLRQWMAGGTSLVAIELGAGTAIPSVRRFTERCGLRYIRINARDPEVGGRLGLGLAGGALAVLRRLADLVE